MSESKSDFYYELADLRGKIISLAMKNRRNQEEIDFYIGKINEFKGRLKAICHENAEKEAAS